MDDDNRWKERGENDEILVLQQQTAIVDYRDSASYLKLIQRLVNSEKFVLLPAAIEMCVENLWLREWTIRSSAEQTFRKKTRVRENQ